MSLTEIKKRKKDHLVHALSEESQVGNAGFENYRFIHNSLPEINFDEIDTSTIFLKKRVNYPFFVSCMTGGINKGKIINRNLAKAAQKHRIAMGVGSQRIAIQHSELESLFKAREDAPDIPLLANVGLVQLNYGFAMKEYQRCIDMIKADALVVHINPIQEIIQTGGDRNWKGLIDKLANLIDKLSVPVIAKEVGFGLSKSVIERLYKIGVRYFDTAGWGGTNWALVEGLRGKANLDLAKTFSQWGIPTAESIKMCSEFRSSLKTKDQRQMVILGSGGVRNGIDIAKSIVLGADLVGVASPFAKAALKSSEEVEKLIEKYALEFKVAMFGVGANSLNRLKLTGLLKA